MWGSLGGLLMARERGKMDTSDFLIMFRGWDFQILVKLAVEEEGNWLHHVMREGCQFFRNKAVKLQMARWLWVWWREIYVGDFIDWLLSLSVVILCDFTCLLLFLMFMFCLCFVYVTFMLYLCLWLCLCYVNVYVMTVSVLCLCYDSVYVVTMFM